MLNDCKFMGRFVKTPELKHTRSDVAVTSFTLAVKRDYGEDKTDFIDCVAWRQTAEFICRHFTQGDLIVVSGSLETRTYETNDGGKRKVCEVNVDKTYFTGKREENREAPKPQNEAPRPEPATQTFTPVYGGYNPSVMADDDLPF